VKNNKSNNFSKIKITIVIVAIAFLALIGMFLSLNLPMNTAYAFETSENDIAFDSYIDELPLLYKESYNSNIDYYEMVSDNFVPFSSGHMVFAGDEISQFLGRIGTVTANAICNDTGQFGVLTSLHVSLNSRMRAGFRWVGTSAPHQQHERVDAAFIPFENQNNWTPTPYARRSNSTFTNIRIGSEQQIIDAYNYQLPIGSIGRTSGIMQNGRVNWLRTFANNTWNSFHTNITLRDGDSGGPVYIKTASTMQNSNTLYLIGKHLAGVTNLAVASRISEIKYHLGITIYCIDVHNLNFTIVNNEATVTGITAGRQNVTDIQIPTHFRGFPVRHIAPFAFSGATILTRVSLPSTLHTIGNFAFADTRNMISITLPEGLQTIGNSAFMGSSVMNLTLPSTVTSIGANAFYNAANLRAISLGGHGSQLRTIGSNAFVGTAPTHIAIPYSVTRIEDNAFRDIRTLTTLTFALNSRLSWIGNNAFRNTGIFTLLIPASVNNLGDGAFRDTFNLRDAVFENSRYLMSIGDNAFRDAVWLGSVTLGPNSRNLVIGRNAFDGATRLIDIDLTGVVTISEFAFRNTGLGLINIPLGVSFIETNAFSGWNSHQSLRIMGRMTVPNGFMHGWSGNARIVFEYNGLSIFNNEIIGFFSPYSNVHVVIPYGITGIGMGAFSSNNNLVSIKIPSSVTRIEDRAFAMATALSEVTFSDNSRLYWIGSQVFAGNNISKIELPYSVTHIAANAFFGWWIHHTITVLGRDSAPNGFASGWSGNATVVWELETDYCIDIDGMQFVLDGDSAVLLRYVGDGSTVVVPSAVNIGGVYRQVLRIADYAFANNAHLQTLYIQRPISDGAITLGNNVFYNTPNLSAIILPCWNGVAFYRTTLNWVVHASIIRAPKMTPVFALPRGLSASGGQRLSEVRFRTLEFSPTGAWEWVSPNTLVCDIVVFNPLVETNRIGIAFTVTRYHIARFVPLDTQRYYIAYTTLPIQVTIIYTPPPVQQNLLFNGTLSNLQNSATFEASSIHNINMFIPVHLHIIADGAYILNNTVIFSANTTANISLGNGSAIRVNSTTIRGSGEFVGTVTINSNRALWSSNVRIYAIF